MEPTREARSLAHGAEFEPERANRFWRPIDGRLVFVKSGQVELHATEPSRLDVPISVVVPAALAADAALGIGDAVDDFVDDAVRTGTVTLDADFVAAEFTASVYPDAPYWVTPRVEARAGNPGYRPQWSLALRAAAGGPPARWQTLLGVSEWCGRPPTRDATVELRIHANPGSQLGASVEIPWRLGFARRTVDERWATILAAVATRVERLKLLSRREPDRSATDEFSAIEIRALKLLRFGKSGNKSVTQVTVPTLSEATLWLAQLGGYTGRSSGGPPGSVTLARRLTQLQAAARALEALDPSCD